MYLDTVEGLWILSLSPPLTATISTFAPSSPTLPFSPSSAILLLLNLATSLQAALSSSSSDELLSSLGRPSRSCITWHHVTRSHDMIPSPLILLSQYRLVFLPVSSFSISPLLALDEQPETPEWCHKEWCNLLFRLYIKMLSNDVMHFLPHSPRQFESWHRRTWQQTGCLPEDLTHLSPEKHFFNPCQFFFSYRLFGVFH